MRIIGGYRECLVEWLTQVIDGGIRRSCRDESTEDPKSYKGIDFVTDVSLVSLLACQVIS